MKRITLIAILAVAPILALSPAIAGSAAVPPTVGTKPVLTATWPAAFTFTPRGDIFFANRLTGEIKVFNHRTAVTHTFFDVPGVTGDAGNERGLLGLAIDPGFPTRPYVFAYATRMVNGTARNQILRIRSSGGVGVSFHVIFTSSTPANTFHNGGHLLFGGGGNLYTLIGEAGDPANSQSLATPAGKILRMTTAGKAPGNNRWGGLIFVTGVRNSFGFTFNPATHKLWETENGPECNDEINQFSNGDNGGWGPHETCDGTIGGTNQDGVNPRLPVQYYESVIAPTGTVFCPASGCGLTAGTKGDLFFGTFDTQNIHEADPADIPGTDAIVLTWGTGILSMERNPATGALYFSDSGGIFKLVPGCSPSGSAACGQGVAP